jgi:hypothetical protein
LAGGGADTVPPGWQPAEGAYGAPVAECATLAADPSKAINSSSALPLGVGDVKIV